MLDLVHLRDGDMDHGYSIIFVTVLQYTQKQAGSLNDISD